MIISKRSSKKKLKNNILSLSQKAKKAKLENPMTINATAGMLFDENDILYTFSSVKKVMDKLSYDRMFAYSDTIGSLRYQTAIKKWLLGNSIDIKEHHIQVVATPGGSGAISLAYTTYLKNNDKVILPNYMWETYITYAGERHLGYITYDLFDENGIFDICSLKKAIDSLYNQETILLIINDPCHNPTGFCMSDDDYDKLVQLLNSYQRNIVLLMDMAYFDYYSPNPSLIRNRYAKLLCLNDNILTLFAFSGSKTFGLYGLRVGACVCISNNNEEVNKFKDAFEYTARANWSSVSTLGMEIISELILNDDYRDDFINELNSMCSMLNERANTFIEESRKCNLTILPFECGFFVCVPTKNPIKLMEALRKDNVYVVSTKTCIRIAICSISISECRTLPAIIKKRMEIEKL